MSGKKKKADMTPEALEALKTGIKTEQKQRDAYAQQLSKESMMYFLVHMNEFSHITSNMDEKTQAWVTANQDTVKAIIESIAKHVITVYAPGVNPSNEGALAEKFPPVLVNALSAWIKEDPSKMDAYSRKAVVYFGIALIPEFRTKVLEESKAAGKIEENRVWNTLEYIKEIAGVMLRSGLPTQAPNHSAIQSLVYQIDFFYNTMSLTLTTYFPS